MTPVLSPVLTARDLPLAELWAARLDGEVVALSTGFLLADLPETVEARALSLGPVLLPRSIVERGSAAWVYGARSLPPRRHCLAMRSTERVAAPRGAGVVLREVVLRTGDTSIIEGVELTTPMRTCADIARHPSFDPRSDGPVLARLLGRAGLDLADCRDYLALFRNLPHKRLALQRITEALLRAGS